jgi:hypothetical protein
MHLVVLCFWSFQGLAYYRFSEAPFIKEGAMPNAKLTQNPVERTKHSGSEPLFLWDERLTGFGVAVYASGPKRYIIQFRVKGSRRSRRMVIGSAARLDLEAARKRAKELLGHVDLGRDPLSEQLRVSTFRALADNYLTREHRRFALPTDGVSSLSAPDLPRDRKYGR